MPFLILATFALVLSPLTSSAQVGDTSVQAQCFDTLRENMFESEFLIVPATTLASISYTEIEADFSAEYGSLSSFDMTTDQQQFSSRIYSFGEQTGYVHPPVSAFPSYTDSDTWSEPAREYVIGEEYVTDQNGVKHFISCYFLNIGSDDPLSATEDRYAFDTPGISILKTGPSGSYYAWYGENDSYDYNTAPFVTWRKMFVYPQATENDFFSKYAVAQAYPANPVTDFSVLEFFAQDLVKVADYDAATGKPVVRYFDGYNPDANYEQEIDESTPDPIELFPDPAVLPVAPEGINLIFPLAQYYQAIEALYPDFAATLSLRGTLKFKTYVEIINSATPNPEINKFLSELGNSRVYDAYYREKVLGRTVSSSLLPNPELDRLLPLIQHADWTVARLKEGATLESLTYIPEETLESVMVPVTNPQADKKMFTLATLVAGGMLLSGLYVVYSRNRRQIYISNDAQ